MNDSLHAYLPIAAALALMVGAPGVSPGAQAFGDREASAIAAAVLPRPDESAWLDIPWETDLWAARRRAASEGKPVFLWEMDGHPLGCT